jgi:hypothetical protein
MLQGLAHGDETTVAALKLFSIGNIIMASVVNMLNK